MCRNLESEHLNYVEKSFSYSVCCYSVIKEVYLCVPPPRTCCKSLLLVTPTMNVQCNISHDFRQLILNGDFSGRSFKERASPLCQLLLTQLRRRKTTICQISKWMLSSVRRWLSSQYESFRGWHMLGHGATHIEHHVRELAKVCLNILV